MKRRNISKTQEARSGSENLLPPLPTSQNVPGVSFGSLLYLIFRTTIKNFFRRLPLSILLALVGYALSIWFVGVIVNGYEKIGNFDFGIYASNRSAFKNFFSIAVVFSILSTVIINVPSALLRRKKSDFFKRLVLAPKIISNYIEKEKADAFLSLLGGIGIAMVTGSIINGIANVFMALGAGLIIASRAGTTLVSLVKLAWDSSTKILRKRDSKQFNIASGYVTLFGSSIGFALNSAITPIGFAVGFVILFSIFIFMFSRSQVSPRAMLLTFLGVFAGLLMKASCLFADDGGWAEFKSDNSNATFFDWLANPKTSPILFSSAIPAFGAMIGPILFQSLVDVASSIPNDLMAGQKNITDEPPPVLVDPQTGEPLIVHDGNYEGGKIGQVWYRDRWMDWEEAERLIEAEEMRQAREFREWQEQCEKEWLEDLKKEREREGLVYDSERDVWVPGEFHEETLEKQRTEKVHKLYDFLERNVDDPDRYEFLVDLVYNIADKGGDLDRLRDAIKKVTVEADQQRYLGEAEEALEEAMELRKKEDYVAGIRDWSRRANRAVGKFVPGSGPVINALQVATYGVIDEYDKNGLEAAFRSATAQAIDELVENYTGIPGTGTGFREACKEGFKARKDGKIVSPLENWAKSVWKGFSSQYDPREYAGRLAEAKDAGDYVDVFLDAADAGTDLYHKASHIDIDGLKRTVKETVKHSFSEESEGIDVSRSRRKLPVIDASEDGEFRSPPDHYYLQDESIDRIRERIDHLSQRIITDENGQKRANLEDVLEIQRRSRAVRTLKADRIPDEVKEAFNNTLRKEVYEPHDRELINYIRENVPGMKDKEIRVHDFRTPGASESTINTDRDFRVLYKDEKGNWLEIPRRKQRVVYEVMPDGSKKVVGKETIYDWEKFSHRKFAELTGYDPEKARSILPTEEDRKLWDSMTEEEKMAKWAELHNQAATDRFHVEAGKDYSDQGLDEIEGAIVQKERPHIVDVKKGDGTLEDPEGLGLMYREKAETFLRVGNKQEAVAQMKKAIHTLKEIDKSYQQQGYLTGKIPENLEKAMDIIEKAPTDEGATIERISKLEEDLRDLGFEGGLREVNDKITSRIGSFKMSRPKGVEIDSSSISTRLHTQEQETEDLFDLDSVLDDEMK